MKKTLKRTLAIVMAVAMLFALSISVFAYDNQGKVTVTIKYAGAQLYQTSLSASDISSYLNPNDSHFYTLPTSAGVTVLYPDTYTAADALLAASKRYFSQAYSTSFTYTWYDVYDSSTYQPITVGEDQVQGLYFTKFWGLDSDYGNYHLTDYNPSTGLYTYYWAGYSWSFSVNGLSYADYYSTEYALNGTSPVVTSVEMDYQYINTGSFTSTSFIPGAIDDRNT